MTNEKRLSIALENLLRDHTPEDLKTLCSDTIDSLVKSLPKERGGSKVQFDGRARGRSVASVGSKNKAVGSLDVSK